jgi:Carboxypeptidase regulatory-like domain/3-keto-disaccharide hydrolase
MKNTKLMIPGLTILALLITGCGAPATPAPTPMPTLTPTLLPTETPTPTPTPTATPVPYDLSVTVTDAQGAPIAGAELDLAFAGAALGTTVKTDNSGLAAWTDLPGEALTLAVRAAGYLPGQAAQTISRGKNDLAVKLERDPFGLLPAQACGQGETLLYSEDFQDGKAQGWGNVTAAIDFAAQNGWSIAPAEEGNLSLNFSKLTDGGDQLQNQTFDNAVWRLKVKVAGNSGFSFLNWRQAPAQGGETRYPLQWGPGGVMMALTRLEQPGPGHFPVVNTQLSMAQDRWYYMEISTYQGETQVWVDGRSMAVYKDPKPLPPGTIGLEAHTPNGIPSTWYFDDLAVCQLSAPFQSLPLPAAQK